MSDGPSAEAGRSGLIAQLRATLAKMETALGTLSESIVWIDGQGRILWCNRGFDVLLGRAHITVLGGPILDLLPLEDDAGPIGAEAHPFRAIFERGSLALRHYRFPKGGSVLTLQISGSLWTLSGHAPVAIMTIQDVTEHERARQALREAELARARAEKEALEREMWIAHRIQTALLPQRTVAPGYAIAGRMLTAEQVGGDYYDVLSFDAGPLWLAIGDVTSHGVTPGLIMMMARTAFAALAARDPMATPGRVLVDLNRVIYENVRERLREHNHMTLTLLRSDGPGRFLFSGAHMDILVRRAASGAVESIATPGTWVGLVPDIVAADGGELELALGDVMLLYTDGVTEATASDGRMFEMAGIEQVLRAEAGGPDALCDRLVETVRRYAPIVADDITVLAVQRLA